MLVEKRPSPLAWVASAGLWIVSVGLALASTFALRDIFVWGLGLLLASPDQASRLRAANTINFAQMCALVIFGVISVGVIVFSSEYFFHYAGQPRFWRRLAGIVAVECVIVLPVALLLWR
ncbi:MAG TPA: hypothetical protein VHD90_11740 [Phototrophicaceae bacterium]|nr:hypothetical protein [Phototrophicaceae bacterium]